MLGDSYSLAEVRAWVLIGAVSLAACAGSDGASTAGPGDTYDAAAGDSMSSHDTSAGDASADGAVDAPGWPETSADAAQPEQFDPCGQGRCWDAPPFAALCGPSSIDEDFGTGLYNVHAFAVVATGGAPLELNLQRTAGSWNPALLLRDAQGSIVHDGEVSVSGGALAVELISSGRGGDVAALRITATVDTPLVAYATGWNVVDSGFVDDLPTDAQYHLTSLSDCEPPQPGELLSPPNFDPSDTQNGYYLLPESMPPGLYTRKPDDCSRGTKLLIDVLYTVAVRWYQIHPELAPIAILDLNEGSCSSVDHETHDDGTHADITAGCATEVDCADDQPAIDLAKLFVETGEACGIINNNEPVQGIINPTFESMFTYEPWHGTFMRTVTGHTHHFHIRVKKPDGMCN